MESSSIGNGCKTTLSQQRKSFLPSLLGVMRRASLNPHRAPLLNATSTTQTIQILSGLLAEGICETAQTYCNGTNTQYSNATSCYQFLTEEVRFGEAYEFGRNTLVCRMVRTPILYLPGHSFPLQVSCRGFPSGKLFHFPIILN